ncbi:MAG: hypothetical protein C0506_09295 [Anaerolinea sp.]|nr:hypothetical protein [Anaerolinea sp.]
MNAAIVGLTVRQLLGAKRTMLLVLVALIPVVIAAIRRFSGNDVDTDHWTATTLLGQLVVGTLLPLGALIFGTATLGSEFEDGTAVYLLSKPIARWRIVASKLVVAWGATSLLVLVSTVASAAVSLESVGEGAILAGFVIAVVLGALVYCSFFVLLSILTSRALIVGLLYVFIWEGVLTRLFGGLRILSVRKYALGVADQIITAPSTVFEADLGGGRAMFLIVAVTALTFVYAARRLRSWEIGEST